MSRALLVASAAAALLALAPASRAAESACANWAAAPVGDVDLSLDSVHLSRAVGLILRDVLQLPYVTSPEVDEDKRPVSVALHGPMASVRVQVSDFLSGMGYSLAVGRSCVARVFKTPAFLPKPPAPPPPPARYPFVYEPVYRDVPGLLSDLSAVLGPSVELAQTAPAPAAPSAPSSPAGGGGSSLSPAGLPASGGASGRFLVLNLTRAQRSAVESLLPRIDVPVPQVLVKVATFEVDLNSTDGTALGLALAVARSRLQLTAGASPSTGTVTGGTVFSLGLSNIDAVAGALATDSRFHILQAPVLRARSGQWSQFVVGSQVPTLGSVSYAGASGTAVQSVNYQNSGVVMSVRPTVRESSIDVDLSQSVSSFVPTTNGVNNSPTLNQREVTETATVSNGELVCLGSLVQATNGKSFDGLPFFWSLFGERQRTVARTDVLVLMQVVRVDTPDGRPTVAELADRARYPSLPGPVESADIIAGRRVVH